MSEGITVPAALLSYLRKGLLIELGFAAERLSILTSDGVLTNEPAYRSVSWSIDATRALLEKIDVVEPAQEDIELEGNDYPFLVFKVLESQHQEQATRLQDAEAGHISLPVEKSHALEVLVTVLGQLASTAQVKQEQQHFYHMGRETAALVSTQRHRSMQTPRVPGPRR